jgi:hypothetical protein
MKKFLSLFILFISLLPLSSFAQSSMMAQPLSVSTLKSATKIKISANATGFSSGLKIGNAVVSVDTTIRVSKKTAYLSIEFTDITGSSMDEILNGTNIFWIVDKSGKSIRYPEKFLKSVGGSMESNVVKYIVKIPFKLKTDLASTYTVRYLFESKDKHKYIDVVATR